MFYVQYVINFKRCYLYELPNTKETVVSVYYFPCHKLLHYHAALIRTRANIGILLDKRCSFSRPLHPDIKCLINPPRLYFSKYFFPYPLMIGYKGLYILKSTNINDVHYGDTFLRFLLIVLQLRGTDIRLVRIR